MFWHLFRTILLSCRCNEAINGQCSRYPVAWKNGKPNYAVAATLTDNISAEETEAASVNVLADAATLSISPNPSVGNIMLKYNSPVAGKINIVIYDKASLAIAKKAQQAIKGDNIYHFNLNNISGTYYIEISNGKNSVRNSFIISR